MPLKTNFSQIICILEVNKLFSLSDAQIQDRNTKKYMSKQRLLTLKSIIVTVFSDVFLLIVPNFIPVLFSIEHQSILFKSNIPLRTLN